MTDNDSQKKSGWKENIADYEKRQEQYQQEGKAKKSSTKIERVEINKSISNAVGILNIISCLVIFILSFFIFFALAFSAAFGNGPEPGEYIPPLIIGLIIFGLPALIGGIMTIRNRAFEWAIISSICAIPAVLGIISLIITLIHKDDFY